MADENLFAMPTPEGDAPPAMDDAADEMFMMPAPDGSAPPAEPEEFTHDFAGASDFASPPVDDFVGNVDETAVEEAPAIILGGPPVVEDADPEEMEEPEEPVEPTGPSPMQIWNEEWQQTLLERKDAENAAKAEQLESSKAAMDEFKAQREAKRESRMANNRSDEQEKLEAIEADLENDNSWQRVCKMVELSQDAAEGAADVGRMKNVLITLKNDTTRAVTLGA